MPLWKISTTTENIFLLFPEIWFDASQAEAKYPLQVAGKLNVLPLITIIMNTFWILDC